jgi:phosphatidylglycerophosphate synthase
MHFIDWWCYDSSKMVVPALPSGITANTITAVSAGVGIASSVLLYHDQRVAAGAAFIFSYWLDSLDGCYARMTGTVTEFGDYFDHITDIIVWVLFAVTLAVKTNASVRPFMILGTLAIVLMGITHLVCQHAVMQQTEATPAPAPFMDAMHRIISLDPVRGMAATEWCSGGAAAVFLGLGAVFLPGNKKIGI